VAPVTPPTYLTAGTYSARLDRQVIGALLTPDAVTGPLAARSGVKPSPGGTGLKVIQRPTPDMWVRVQPGTCYIQAVSSTGGAYVCQNDSDYDVQLDAAHATLPRKDLIYARAADAADDTGSLNEFIIDALTGTPAASPVRPALPSQAIGLAEAAVAAAGTSIVTANITDLRTHVTALGGTLPIVASANIPASPYPGMRIYRQDLAQPVEQVWDGTAWRTVMDTGYGATYGTLGYAQWDCVPDYVIGSGGGTSIRYDGTNPCRLNFTVPSGLPTTRVLRFTVSMNVGITTGARLWGMPWLDSTTGLLERRVGIPSDGFARGWSQITSVGATTVAPGAHFMEWRARIEVDDATVFSIEFHVELV
jgi:hypothetical protein